MTAKHRRPSKPASEISAPPLKTRRLGLLLLCAIDPCSGGGTWIEDASVGATKEWSAVAMSADGTKQTGCPAGGNLWTSTDSGATWTEDTSVGATKFWNAVAMSADGTRQTAAVSGYENDGGNLWTSTDSGATWTEDTSVGETKYWRSVAMSADGTKQTAVEPPQGMYTGSLWTSTDSGATWTEDASVGAGKVWFAVAMSADGTKRTAATSGDNLWTYSEPPPPTSSAGDDPTFTPSSAGDDPTFIGSDGAAYHVLGIPWKYFNVISAPTISLNAQFLPVKPNFVHGKITDTVLGLLHLAICDAATGRTLGVLFDVFSGERHCTLRQPGEPEFGGSKPTDCATALASFGVSISEEGAACLLQFAQCGHVPVSKLQATLRDEPSAVQLNMARFNVSVGGTRLSLLRDLIDRPELPIDCGPLARWSRAHKACEVIARSLSGQEVSQELRALSRSDRVAVMAYLTAGNTSQQMHFHNVLVEALPFPQSDVHGLLGQRSVGPVPPILTANKLAAHDDGSFISTEQLSVDATGTTIRATVAADGTVPLLQGEGAIEGVYTSYQVKHISLHGAGAFAYTRFNCPAPPVESRD